MSCYPMSESLKIGIIIAARLTSNRFPQKILAGFKKNGKTKEILQHVIDEVNKINIPYVVAIPNTKDNDLLEYWLETREHPYFRGLENDLIDRFYQCAKLNKLDVIIQLNGENPLISFHDIIFHLDRFLTENRFIYGDHVWIYDFNMIEYSWINIIDAENRQGVTRGFFNSIDYRNDIERIEKYTDSWSRTKPKKIRPLAINKKQVEKRKLYYNIN